MPAAPAGYTQGDVLLRLTADEALVLDSLLSRFDNGAEPSTGLELQHPAERAALWALSAALERELVAPFEGDYAAQLERAQKLLVERAGL